MKRLLFGVLVLAVAATGMAAESAKTCKATSDIPQFQVPEFQRVCNGPHLRTVTFMGTHERAVYTISDDRDYTGKDIADTQFSRALESAAKDAHERLYDLYPMERFEYRLKDAKDRPICAFRFSGQGAARVAGWCLDHVED
jgi:hypothetical protein